MALADQRAASSPVMATMGHECLASLRDIAGNLESLATSRLDAHQRDYVERMRATVDALLVTLGDMLGVSGSGAMSPGTPREFARAIARDWEALVWAVEDEERDSAMEHLRSLEGHLGIADRDVMAPYCRSLEQHIVHRGFEGLTPILYEFHVRIQSMLGERRLAAAQADG